MNSAGLGERYGPGQHHGCCPYGGLTVRSAPALMQLQFNSRLCTPVAATYTDTGADTALQDKAVVQQLQHACAIDAACKQPARPQQDLRRLISSRLKQTDNTAAVLILISGHARQFNQVHTALAFAQLSRQLRFETPEGRAAALQHPTYLQLLHLAAQQSQLLKPRQLTMILTSMAWMHTSDSDSTSRSSRSRSTMEVSSSSSTDLQETSSLPAPPPAAVVAAAPPAATAPAVSKLLDALMAQMQPLLNSAEPEDICHCLWALTKLGQCSNQGFVDLLFVATAHSVSTGWVHLLTGKPLTSLLWVHAHLHLHRQQRQWAQQHTGQQLAQGDQRLPDQQQQQQQHLPSFLAVVMQELQQPGFLGTWTPQELSMLLWSCAVLQVPVGPSSSSNSSAQQPYTAALQLAHLQQQQQQRFQVEQQQQQQQHNEQWLPVLPYQVLQEVCNLSVQQVVRFAPQGIANTCWAVAKLVQPSDGTQQQEQQQQQQQGSHLDQQQLPSSVRSSVVQLFETFAAAAATQLHYYKPQEVANLASACARMQFTSKQLGAAISHYVHSHSHLLSATDALEVIMGFVKTRTLPEPSVVHALVHQLVHRMEQMRPYQLVAAAWALVRVSELLRQQYHASHTPLAGVATETAAAVLATTAAATPEECLSTGCQLQQQCLAAAHLLLDGLTGVLQQAPTAWQQLTADPGGRPLIMLLWAISAISTTHARQAAAWDVQYDSHKQRQQQVQQQQQPQALQQQQLWQLLEVLQQAKHCCQTCSMPTLAQLLCVLTKLSRGCLDQSEQQQQQQHLQQEQQMLSFQHRQQVADICRAAESRLLQGVAQLQAQQVVAAVWAVHKLQSARCSSSRSSRQLLKAGFAVLQQHQQQVAELPAHAVTTLFWICSKVGSWPEVQLLQVVLRAADQRLLQMTVQQQVLLLRSLGDLQQWQQQQVQQQGWSQQQEGHQGAGSYKQQLSSLVVQLANRLQMLLQQQLAGPTGHNGRASSVNSNSSSIGCNRAQVGTWQSYLDRHKSGTLLLQWQQQRQQCTPRELLALAAACVQLPQLRNCELLLTVVELWQQQLEQQQVGIRQAMAMLWILAGVPVAVGAVTQLLPVGSSSGLLGRQQQQGQQQQWQLELSEQTQAILDQFVTALHQHLLLAPDQRSQHDQQAVQATVVAPVLRLFAKLQYQPSSSLLQLCKHHLVAALPSLPAWQILMAVVATTQLGLPLGSLLGIKELHRLQQYLAAQEQPSSCKVYQLARLPRHLLVKLFWSLLCNYQQPGASTSKRLLMRLATTAAAVGSALQHQQQQQQLSNYQIELLQLLLQCRQLLNTCKFRSVRQALRCQCLSLPRRGALLQPLQRLSALLLPLNAQGAARRKVLTELLHSPIQQLQQVLQQSLATADGIQQQQQQQLQQAQLHNIQQQQQLQQELKMLAPLLPLWQQQQLQVVAVQYLAAQLAAAGLPVQCMRLRHLADGKVALVLHQQLVSGACEQGVSNNGSSSSVQGVAVLLEPADTRAVNTGRPLGPGLGTMFALKGKGYSVCSMPLATWLPEWLVMSNGLHQSKRQQHQQGEQQRQSKLRQLLAAVGASGMSAGI